MTTDAPATAQPVPFPHYVAQRADGSHCGTCGHPVLLLTPDWQKPGDPIAPAFYVCLNDGAVGQVGVAPIAVEPSFVEALRAIATTRRGDDVALPTGGTVRVRWSGARWPARTTAGIDPTTLRPASGGADAA